MTLKRYDEQIPVKRFPAPETTRRDLFAESLWEMCTLVVLALPSANVVNVDRPARVQPARRVQHSKPLAAGVAPWLQQAMRLKKCVSYKWLLVV